MTLTEFLLARIAEDEADATQSRDNDLDWFDSAHQIRWTPARVLAECEAKRLIVWEECATVRDFDDPVAIWLRDGVLRALALPYADHPDYDEEEWRP